MDADLNRVKDLKSADDYVAKNIVIEERYASGRAEKIPGLAAELVALDLDVIVSHGGTLEAKRP